MDPDTDVDLHFPSLLRTYKSGRIERLKGTAVVPAGLDPATAVASKDVTIDPVTALSARLYLPKTNAPAKLPILLYFHGGAFIIESAFSPTYHSFLNPLAAAGGLLTVSVDYRRAPEHPLPVPHDDSSAALQWVLSRSDPWLAEHGDSDRLFLAGDSAGANIAHHVALRAGVRLSGLAMIHPYFAVESSYPGEAEFIERVLTQGLAGGDELLLVPRAAESFEGMVCKRVVVFVAEKDGLRERGRGYYDALVGSDWGGEAELVENAGEDHVFHLIKPDCESAAGLKERFPYGREHFTVPDDREILSSLKILALEYQYSHHVRVFVYAAFYATSCKYGIVAYVSDHDFIEALSGSTSLLSALEVECYAIWEAILLISNRGFSAAVIYSDSLLAVQYLHSDLVSWPWQLVRLLSDCRLLWHESSSTAIVHISRNGNIMAHMWAQSTAMNSSKLHWATQPLCLETFYVDNDFTV